MLPFLYPTKTLASLPRLPFRRVPQSSITRPVRWRNFYVSSRCANESSDGPGVNVTENHGFASQPSKVSQESGKSQGPGYNVLRDVLFGYNPQKTSEGASQATASQDAEADDMEVSGYSPFDMTTDHELLRQDEEPQYEPADSILGNELTNPRRNRKESTITIAEREAFQRIFEDIFARNQASQQSDKAMEEDESNYPSNHQPSVTSGALGRILQGAADSSNQRWPQTLAEKEAAVNRYPPVLRTAAAKAMGLTYGEDSTIPEEEETEPEQALVNMAGLDKLRLPERDRVEGLMRAANTDFELWNVLEKEVFSLVAKLGLEVGSPGASPIKPKKGKKLKRKGGESVAESTMEAKSPVEGISALDFYGPLYPSYLLLALRLLDRSFAQPSTLTMAILPKIKSLGLISHVLGASTSFYNEIMDIYAFRQDNLSAVSTLLAEMQQAGLEWDEGTLEVLENINSWRQRVMSGFHGRTAKTLWQLPEWAPHRFNNQARQIRSGLPEKRREEKKAAMEERYSRIVQ